MLRKIQVSDGRRGDDFGTENNARYSPSGDRILNFDADHTDSGPVLNLLTRRALGIRGNKLRYPWRLLAKDSILSVID